MNGKTVLKWLGGVGLGVLAVGTYRKFGNLSTASQLIFDLDKVKIVGLDKMYITVLVSNPTPGTVTFNSINTELYFNGINIGRLYYNQPLMVAAKSQQSFQYPVILYPAGVVQIASNMLERNGKEGVFNMNGKVYVNDLPIPINKTKKLW
jgi:LEA14-like dessication related protein